jgi:hypothetical protein
MHQGIAIVVLTVAVVHAERLASRSVLSRTTSVAAAEPRQQGSA